MTNFFNLSTFDKDTDKTLYKHTLWFAMYMNKILKFKNSDKEYISNAKRLFSWSVNHALRRVDQQQEQQPNCCHCGL